MYNNWFQRLFLISVLTIAIGFLISQRTIVGIGYGIGVISIGIFIRNLVAVWQSGKSITVHMDEPNSNKDD